MRESKSACGDGLLGLAKIELPITRSRRVVRAPGKAIPYQLLRMYIGIDNLRIMFGYVPKTYGDEI